MPHHSFTIYTDGVAPDHAWTMALPDDAAAWDFGECMIRDVLDNALKFDTRLMEIADGARIIATIAFDLKALRSPRTLQ
jgi:hypothetical protein